MCLFLQAFQEQSGGAWASEEQRDAEHDTEAGEGDKEVDEMRRQTATSIEAVQRPGKDGISEPLSRSRTFNCIPGFQSCQVELRIIDLHDAFYYSDT